MSDEMMTTLVILAFIGLIIYAITHTITIIRESKRTLQICENLEASQTNENVDEFMKTLLKYGLRNEPTVWNRMRGIWFMVNESPNVTTDRKVELRNKLVSNGLRLTPNERKIIDNYR